MGHTSRNRDWSKVQKIIIAGKLWFYRNYRKFASTCSCWYKIKKEVHGSFEENLVSLVLPCNNETSKCAFYQIFDARTYEINIPELRDKIVYGSSSGWLIVSDDNFRLSLINPLTRKQVELPERSDCVIDSLKLYSRRQNNMFDPFKIHSIISKVVLDNSSSSTCYKIAMIVTPLRLLQICQLGDNAWYHPHDPSGNNYARKTHGCELLNDVLFFKSKVYAIDRGDNVLTVNFNEPTYNMQLIRGPLYYHPERTYSSSMVKFLRAYLVECYGNLLAIQRFGMPSSARKSHKTHYFKLYQFEENKETWKKIYGLGDKCIFLGQNESLCVTAVEVRGCKPNCIYFSDDFYCGRQYDQENYNFGFQNDNGVFCFEDHTVQHFDISHSMTHWVLPSVWCQLKM